MKDIHNDGSFYVCITHKTIIPCNEGDSHLISNWKIDVEKILEAMEAENGNLT